MLKGSLSVTGMEIFVKSLPMFLYKRFQRLTSGESGLGTGSFVRRPVAHISCVGSSVTVQKIQTDKYESAILDKAAEGSG